MFILVILMIPVAPFAGAWIEISNKSIDNLDFTSLPSRERGLKCRDRGLLKVPKLSLPSRERGLK